MYILDVQDRTYKLGKWILLAAVGGNVRDHCYHYTHNVGRLLTGTGVVHLLHYHRSLYFSPVRSIRKALEYDGAWKLQWRRPCLLLGHIYWWYVLSRLLDFMKGIYF